MVAQRRTGISTTRDDDGNVFISVNAERWKMVASFIVAVASAGAVLSTILMAIVRPSISEEVRGQLNQHEAEVATLTQDHNAVHSREDAERRAAVAAIADLTKEVKAAREDLAELKGYIRADRR